MREREKLSMLKNAVELKRRHESDKKDLSEKKKDAEAQLEALIMEKGDIDKMQSTLKKRDKLHAQMADLGKEIRTLVHKMECIIMGEEEYADGQLTIEEEIEKNERAS